MKWKKISDYTEQEFLGFVRDLFDASNTTDAEDIENILDFKRLAEDSPEGVVQEVKEWRQVNGKSGFKS